MKPTLLFAFCALIMLVSAAPAQSPQHDPAHEELTALIKEVRAQQAAMAANQAKIERKTRHPGRNYSGRANLFQPRRPIRCKKCELFIIARGNACRCCHWCCPNSRTDVTPVPTQAATPALVPDAKQQAEMAENIKELQELKAQNDEILKQQQAALDAA